MESMSIKSFSDLRQFATVDATTYEIVENYSQATDKTFITLEHSDPSKCMVIDFYFGEPDARTTAGAVHSWIKERKLGK